MNTYRIATLSIALATAFGTAFAGQGVAKAVPAPTPVTLHVGDSAPPVAVMKWLKGKPVDLKDGKVHVVEFWATWCGPCKVGMPHLSELAGKFKKDVVFSGISVWEPKGMKDKTADTMPKVEDFVNHAHDMMAYNVAADGSAAIMTNSWMKAAGQRGIPAAFVVDQKGKIAWIGHPLLGLEDVLPLVVAHKFDAAAAQKVSDDWKAKMEFGQDVLKELQAAQIAKDNAKVITLCDKVNEDLPYMVAFCAQVKYVALENTDPAAASRFIDELMKEDGNAPIVLSEVASAIADDKSDITGKRDYTVALKLMKKAEECATPDYSFDTAYASVLAKSGDSNGAVKWESDALKSAQDSGYPKELIDSAQKKLDDYRLMASTKQHGGK